MRILNNAFAAAQATQAAQMSEHEIKNLIALADKTAAQAKRRGLVVPFVRNPCDKHSKRKRALLVHYVNANAFSQETLVFHARPC